MRALVIVFAFVLLAQPAWAVEIADVTVKEEIVADDGATLRLNGAGIRSKFFFKIYIAELYLENTADTADKVIADTGRKRIVMHFLYNSVSQDKLVEAWNEGFEANLGKEELENLQPRIDAFNAMFKDEMASGDVCFFDYVPGEGTRVTIKGEEKGVIEGKDFNDALLSIWLGDDPVGSELKKDLLGL